MIVRIIMTNVDILDYNHRINVTVALADQTAPACIDTRLLWVWILSLSCQIYIWIYSSFVYFVFVCVLRSFIIQHTVALLHRAQTTIKSLKDTWDFLTSLQIISEIDESDILCKKNAHLHTVWQSCVMILGLYIWRLVEEKCAMPHM